MTLITTRATGAERIAIERQRQLVDEGYDDEHDDEHTNFALALAASCYAASAAGTRIFVQNEFATGFVFEDPWPWGNHFDRRPYDSNDVLKEPTDDQAIRMLEKAGALIAAEIDRLLRAREKAEKKA